MINEMPQLERELERSQAQTDATREADKRILQAQDLAQYQQLGDGSYQRDFTDRQGRAMTLRVEGNDQASTSRALNAQTQDSTQFIRIRAYDTAGMNNPSAAGGPVEAGYANANLEVRHDGDTYQHVADSRLRLADIKAHDQYEGNGIGGQMLDEVERIGREHGAKEVYGNFMPETGKEAATRRWYEGHGFEFRPKTGGGEEVYKNLTEAPTDAADIRRELRR